MPKNQLVNRGKYTSLVAIVISIQTHKKASQFRRLFLIYNQLF